MLKAKKKRLLDQNTVVKIISPLIKKFLLRPCARPILSAKINRGSAELFWNSPTPGKIIAGLKNIDNLHTGRGENIKDSFILVISTVA